MTGVDSLSRNHVGSPNAPRVASRPIRVAVIDGQPLFRQGIAQVLRRAEHMVLVAEGSTLAEAASVAGKDLADVMLLEPDTIGEVNLEATCRLAREQSRTRIILITDSECIDHVMKALDAGVRGYILRTTEVAELTRIIEAVSRDETFITPWLAARLLAQTRAAKAAAQLVPPSPLTPRETQILAQVSRGCSNKEVANALLISEKTVKHYLTSIFDKLQVRNRVEAVVKAHASGLAAADERIAAE